jgi:sulfite reductase alpha subunit-like flavoprotein
MNNLVDQLILVIREEEDVLERFLECLNTQKECIVQNRIDDFDRTVKLEEELIKKVRLMESQRMTLVKSIAKSTGQSEDELTLTRLIEINLGEASEELKQLKRGLANLVDKIKKTNKVNQYLIRRSLSIVQRNIDWFIDGGELNVVYAENGQRRVKNVGNLLVNKTL